MPWRMLECSVPTAIWLRKARVKSMVHGQVIRILHGLPSPSVNMFGTMWKLDKMRLYGQVKNSPTLSRRQVEKSQKSILARMHYRPTSCPLNINIL